MLGHGNCSNGVQKCMCRGFSTNRRYGKRGRYHCNSPEKGSKQSMQQPIKRISSDSQCLELVTSARASVASCLYTIDFNVACFTHLMADGFVAQPALLQNLFPTFFSRTVNSWMLNVVNIIVSAVQIAFSISRKDLLVIKF